MTNTMECNCTANLKHPYGNPLRIAIDMTLRTMSGEGEDITTQDEPFIPGGPVRVVLQSGAKQYTYDAAVEGNVATVLDSSKLPIGTYSVEISTVDQAGTPFRCKYRNVVTVVDYSCEAGICPPTEFQVETQHLDALFSSLGYGGNESDPTIPEHVKGITQQDIGRWDSKQDAIPDLAAIRAKAKTAVQDPNYQHTDNNFTDAEKEKLAGLENFDPSGLAELDEKTTRVKYGQSSTVVLDVIELPGGDDDDEGEAISIEAGMIYGKSNGHLIYVKNDEVEPVEYDLGLSTGLVFFNKADNKFYRYNGTRWVQAGNSGDGGTVEQVQADWDETDTSDPSYIKNKPDLFSGNYSDLSGKPTIPTALSQMNDDSAHRTVTDTEKAEWSAKQAALTFDEVPTEDSTNPVESGGVYAALEDKAPKPKNTVYVDLAYWNSHKASGTVFSADDTHYILAHDFYNVVEQIAGPAQIPVQVFGKRCVFSAQNGCRFGRMRIQFTDTYIAVGQQQIFKQIEYAHPSSYETTATNIVEDGTRIAGTFANSRILVEWWGAVGGRGVRGEDGTFENAATESQALKNAIAFNLALRCAGQSEVYAPAPMYMIGASIMDTKMPVFRDGIAKDSDGQFDPDTNDDNEINLTVTSYTKLYVEGDLVASNEFIGAKRNCGSAWVEIPAVVRLEGNMPRCIIRGAVVVPFSAQDKSISIVSSLPASPVVGTTYFISKTQESDPGANRYFDVYDAYYHYTSNTTNAKEVLTRKVGEFYTSASKISRYVSPDYLFGGKNRNYTKSGNDRYLKMPGMYGMSISSIGGYIEVCRILKGDHRGGYWNMTQDKKLMSYRYRKEVMHQGHCTAMVLNCVKASTIKVGQIEGFNDGVAFDGTHSPVYDAVEFNHFEFGSIACNYAVHLRCGSSYACLVNASKDTKEYFDGCSWRLGGFEPFSAGSNCFDTFCPTTSKSTYFLIENDAGNGGGFSNHWIEWDNAPLRWYTSIVDIARANDNQFIMHGNTSGDTGRVVLWTTKSGITGFSKYRKYLDSNGNEVDSSSGTLHYKFPSEFNGGNKYIKAGEEDTDDKVANCFQLANGESLSDAWFPVDTFAGFESMDGYSPYAYAHLAAMSNKENVWETQDGYPISSHLAPYASGQLAYDEWSCPFDATRSFINFRGGSHVNIVQGGRKHMLCYDSVYCDASSGSNELRHAQSAYAMFQDTHGGNVNGHWSVLNAFHPVYDKVRFDYFNDPRTYQCDNIYHQDRNDTNIYPRTMFVPDENTLSCLKVVSASSDITDAGLYILSGTEETGISGSSHIDQTTDETVGEGIYNATRYQLWEKFGSTTRQVGWISSIYLKLVEGGGSGFSGDYNDLTNKPTNVSSFTNDAGYLTSHQDISGKADKVAVVEVSDAGAVSQALDPNKFYNFTGALTSLSLTLVSGTGFVMYAGKFTTGSGWGSNGLSIPATVTEAANNDEIAASKTYEFSILDNVIVIKEV